MIKISVKAQKGYSYIVYNCTLGLSQKHSIKILDQQTTRFIYNGFYACVVCSCPLKRNFVGSY